MYFALAWRHFLGFCWVFISKFLVMLMADIFCETCFNYKNDQKKDNDL